MTITSTQRMEAYSRLPRPIREYLAGDELGKTVMQMGQTYQLHVDTQASLSRIVTETLLGFISPKELPAELNRQLGLPEAQIPTLIADINTEIFIPIQKHVREWSTEDAEEDARRNEQNSAAARQVPQSSPDPLPVMQVAGPVIPTPDPVSYGQAAPIATPPQPPASVPIYMNAQPLPHARTMASDMEMASHGLQGQPATPARSFQTASVPITRTIPSPQQLTTGRTSPQPIVAPTASYQPPTMAPVRLTPVDRVHAGAPITKEFGSDPYREPIE